MLLLALCATWFQKSAALRKVVDPIIAFNPFVSPHTTAKPLKTETFEFHRHLVAVLQGPEQNKPFADIDFGGSFTVDWKDEQTARVSYQLSNGEKSRLAFEIHLSNWKLVEIKSEVARDKAGINEQNILKDFASIFAYRSNEDTTGKYEAEYTDEPERLFKRKTLYNSVAGLSVRIVKSEHEFTRDPGTLELISGRGEEATRAVVSKQSFMLAVSSYTIRRLNSVVSRRVAQSDEVRPDTLRLTPESKGVASWSQVRGGLERFNQMNEPERLKLYHDVSRTIVADSEGPRQFNDWMNIHLDQPNLRNFSIGVLATVGTAEAQQALIKIYAQYPESRVTVLNSLATAGAPFSEETHQFLSTLLLSGQGNLSYGAAFALGAGIQNQVTPASEDVQQLSRLLTNAATPDEQEIYLDAIGNSGSLAFLGVIETSMQSLDEGVREKAVLALRKMPAVATQSLLNLAGSDASVRVKAAATQVGLFQSVDGFSE